MGSSSKRQQTAAKRNREHMLRERRELKAQRKADAKERKAAIARGEILPDEPGEAEEPLEGEPLEGADDVVPAPAPAAES